ncbi:MAG: TonB-dependent receptor, partial [Bdellovibrionia bacterium]
MVTEAKILLIGSVFLFLPQAFADTDSPVPQAEQIVVTANRVDTPEDQVTSSYTVITKEEIERKQKTQVADLLRDIPGLSVTNAGGPGKTTSVYVRGADPASVLVFIDGIEMNDPLSTGRGFDFGNFSTQDIEKIEVIRGSQSVLYGSDATGGVIQIFTKKGAGALQSSFEGEYGTYKSYRLQGNVRGSIEKLKYFLGVGHFTTEGFPASDQALGNTINNGQSLTTLTGNLGLELAPKTTLNWSGRYSNSNYTFSTGGPPGSDGFGGRTGDDPGYNGTDVQGYTKIQMNSWITDFWEPQVSLTYSLNHRTSDHVSNPLNPSASNFTYDSNRIRALFQNNLYWGESQNVTIGLDSAVENGTASELYPPSTADSGIKGRSDFVHGIFVQDLLKLGDFFGTLGGRYDIHQYAGNAFTYRIAPGYKIDSTHTTLRASLNTGFKAPSLYQLFSTYGNSNLKSERSTSFEVGLDQELLRPGTKLSMTYFQTNYDQLVTFDS